jgi:N-acetylneuraminic acid mutarotase
MAAAAVVGNKIYVIGGGDKDSFLPIIRPSVAIYDPASNSWTQGADMPTPRFLHAAAAFEGKVYAMGGTVNGNDIYTDIVERYDPDTDTWTTVANMLNRKRGHSASVLRGGIYSVGGVAMGFGLSGLVESYDPQGNRWISRPDLKYRRFGHNSLAVDGHIIAFGGFSSSTDLTKPAVVETEIYTD